MHLELGEPAAVTVEAREPDGNGLRASTELDAASHEIPLVGLRPEHDYSVTVEVTDGSGDMTSFELGSQATGSLPDSVPPVEVERAEGVEGYTLFDLARGGDGDGDNGFLVVLDPGGEIVWWHSQPQSIQDARQLADGDLVYIHHETGVRQLSFDRYGSLVREWVGTTGAEVVPEDDRGNPVTGDDPIRVDTDQMHHEVRELPDGNLLTLSREVRTVEYPENICDDDDFDGTYEVGGDVVVEFEPDTGAIVREFSLFDVLDPVDNLDRTMAGEFCGPYLDPVYPDRDVRDWTHANAVVLDEANNRLLVSVRHTDEIIALRYEDDAEGEAGELLWSLGEGRDFELVDGGEWFLHPHAPEVLPDGSILLYDNANRRPGTSIEDGPLPESRAVRYELDEEAGTAEQVWEFGSPADEGPLYAPYVGDADRTDAGTVLITHGGLLDPPAHGPGDDVLQHSRILEVDPDDDSVLLDVTIRDPDDETGWRAYRAERLDDLYPPGYEVEVLD
ncbi:MAG: aryl-sulfate sulfotransferase [Acidimicrobiales bacterium]